MKLNIAPKTREAYQLFHKGTLVLGEIEKNGINMDVDFLKKQRKIIASRTEKLKEEFEKTKLGKTWKEIKKEDYNINSNPQLADILFNYLNYTPTKLTKKEKPSTSQEALEELNLPEFSIIQQYRKLSKLYSTYIVGIIREIGEDGLLHPSFSLNIPISFRSSSSNPNFQNIPIRDPESSSFIRPAFIPRSGRRILEADFKGVEVSISAAYHEDPNLIAYIEDSKKDMHRDMAAMCFKCDTDQITKETRYCGKNMFVFPQFYGSYYVDCATSLWNAISKMNLKLKDGTLMLEHLKHNKINDYEDFEFHIKKIERTFWYEMFPTYTKWKEKIIKQYERRGHINTLTGFTCSGAMRRNEVINYVIQGASFHCLLWSLIRLWEYSKEEKWESLPIGQIHDSMLWDTTSKEFLNVGKKIIQVSTKEILDEWKWINVPLLIEIEASDVDENWHKKKEISIDYFN
ncbi:MAG: DNA polymerase [Candidatus Heimdallarchaeaceae archaeon]